MRSGSLSRIRAPYAVLAAAVLVSALLFGSALVIRATVREASELTTRGMGEALTVAGDEAFAVGEWPPDREMLEELLAAHQEEGLRYVAIVTRDGKVLASAGEPTGSTLEEGTVERIGKRARVVHVLRIPRRRLAEMWQHPPQLPFMQPPGEGRPRFRPPLLVYEFEPLASQALQHRSRQLLVVAAISCLGILGLAIAFARALSQREHLVEQLEHGRRLAALGSMSAVLAHELRNPLASLKGHAQLLAETVEEDPKLFPRADRVVSEAVRLERLMDDLLTFVRSGELKRAPTDPDEVLRAAVESVGDPAIEASYLAHPGRWRIDGPRLQQALENVLRNARQASPGGARIEAAVDRDDGNLVFLVKDRGPGIAPGDEDKIFEPFVTGRIRGVGLGLAITRRIVELHGGTVSARNRSEGGAEFRLVVPGKEA